MTTTLAMWRWPWAEAFRLVRRPRAGRRQDQRTARPPRTMRRRPHPRALGHRCQWRSLRYRSQGRSTCCCGPASTVGAERDASVTGATPLTASLTKNGSRASTHRSVRYAISGTTGATCAGDSTGLRRRLMGYEALCPGSWHLPGVHHLLSGSPVRPSQARHLSSHTIASSNGLRAPPFPDRALLLAPPPSLCSSLVRPSQFCSPVASRHCSPLMLPPPSHRAA